MAYAKARGKCCRCGRTRSLNADGTVRRHPVPGTNGERLCPGSGAYSLTRKEPVHAEQER